MKDPSSTPQHRNKANVFICYSPSDADFVRELDEALKRSRRRSAINWTHDLYPERSPELLTLIEAADTFLFVISPDSIKSATCLNQLDHALKQSKLIVPIIHREVQTEDLPVSLVRLNAVRFDATYDFHESFQSLIREIPTDLKVDVFICYSRADKSFVDTLYSQLEEQERSAWVDLKNIPFAERWEQEIYQGIEAADNFLFVISPDSIKSEYCARELNYAIEQRKRVVPLLLRAVDIRAVSTSLSSLQWIDFSPAGDPDGGVDTLIKTIEADQGYTRMHTRILSRALEWMRGNHDDSFLLRGSDLMKAEKWLVQVGADIAPKPTQLQTRYVIRSRQTENSRQRKATVWVTAGLVIAIALAVLAVAQSVRAESQRKVAEEQKRIAEEQTVIAEKRQREAEEQRIRAEEQTREAQRQKEEALRQQGIAEEQTEEARQQREQKEAQRRIAEVKRLEAEAQRRVAVEQRNLALSRELAVRAKSRLNDDPELSALLALEAINRSPTAEATEILKESLDEARARVVLEHPSGIYNASYNHDGSLIVTAAVRDRKARVWDAKTGKNLAVLRAEGPQYRDDTVREAIFSPDGKLIATAGDDDTAELWETTTGKKVADLKGGQDGSDIKAIAFSPDSKLIATLQAFAGLHIWNAGTGEKLRTLKISMSMSVGGIPGSAIFSPDSKLIAAVSHDHEVYVWEVATGSLQGVLCGHRERIGSFAFSPDSKRVVTASVDKTARIWEAATGRSLFELRGHTGFVISAVFSPDGKWVATASGQTGRIWDAETGEVWAELSGHTDAVRNVTFSPSGRFVLTPSSDDTVRVWELQTAAWKGESIGARLLAVLRGHKGSVASAAFSPNERFILTASDWDKTVRVWEAPTGVSALELTHQRDVHSAAFSPDGRYILTTSSRNEDEPDWNTVRLWDAATGKLLRDVKGYKRVYGAEFSPDGKYIAASLPDAVVTWETETGKTVTHLPSDGLGGYGLLFSPDGKFLALQNGYDKVRLWNFPAASKYVQLQSEGWRVDSLAFSPNGKFLAGGGEFGELRLWNAATGERIFNEKVGFGKVSVVEFSPDGSLIAVNGNACVVETATGRKIELGGQQWYGVFHVAFSPDGKLLVTASKDKVARIWDTKTWRLIAELRGHTDEVWQARFSSNSQFVVTASRDGRARIWDATTGRNLAELRGANEFVETASFSPDGRAVVTTARGNNVARVYKCETCLSVEELIRLAQGRITRPPLTTDERQKYLHNSLVK